MLIIAISSVQYADAAAAQTEPVTYIIEGFDKNREIYIKYNGISNTIILQSATGISEHSDFKVKTYKSGSFSVKNAESGIAMFAHLEKDGETFKLVVLTTNGIYRFIGIPGILVELYEKPITDFSAINATSDRNISGSVNSTIEDSSGGADLRRNDIPTEGRPVVPEFLLSFKSDFQHSIGLTETYDVFGNTLNARKALTVANVTVTAEISRDEYVIREQTDTSNKYGKVHLEFPNISYPEFFGGFCYDVTVTAVYDEHEVVWKDDFIVMNPRAGVELDFSWLSQDRWNYLPESFREIPPKSINSDKRCNGM